MKSIYKISKFILIFSIILAWTFNFPPAPFLKNFGGQGWPQINLWMSDVQNYNFPPEVQEARAATDTYTRASGTNADGYGSWVVPAGVTSAIVACWGGGGGGGDGLSGDGGGGAGGGAFASSTITSLVEGTQYTIYIGAGGGRATADGGTGVDGENSSFATTTVVAAGGKGGPGGLVGGGAGGTIADSTGQTEYAGGSGGAGVDAADKGGGGGGAGGPHGAGGDGLDAGGAGGAGDAGSGGAGGAGGAPNPGADHVNGGGGGGGGGNGTAGGDAGAPGGGGGGGEVNYGSTDGDGAGGQCTVTYTVPVSVTLDQTTFSYGTMNDNTASSTLTLWSEAGIIATNGDAIADFYIYGADTANWTLDSATSTQNYYTHKFCNETDNNCLASGPYGADFTALATSTQLLKGSVAASGQVAFQLSMHTPNPSTVYTQQSVVVTIQASAP